MKLSQEQIVGMILLSIFVSAMLPNASTASTSSLIDEELILEELVFGGKKESNVDSLSGTEYLLSRPEIKEMADDQATEQTVVKQSQVIKQSQVGDEEWFWSYYNEHGTGYSQVLCEYLYVDGQISVAAQVDYKEFIETSGMLQSVIDNFTYIIDTESTVFANPEGVLGTIGDGTYLVLFVKASWYLRGWFDPINELYREEDNILQYTNQQEMLYVNVVEPSPVEIVAHEFQHLIMFNNDWSEWLWLNEGLSEAARYICGLITDPNNLTELAYSYLESKPAILWDTGSVYHSYGSAYLFIIYVIERFGLESLQYFYEITFQGVEQLKYTFGIYGADFYEELGQWWFSLTTLPIINKFEYTIINSTVLGNQTMAADFKLPLLANVSCFSIYHINDTVTGKLFLMDKRLLEPVSKWTIDVNGTMSYINETSQLMNLENIVYLVLFVPDLMSEDFREYFGRETMIQGIQRELLKLNATNSQVTESGIIVFPDEVFPNDTRLFIINHDYNIKANETTTFYSIEYLPSGHYSCYLYSDLLTTIWVGDDYTTVTHSFDMDVEIETEGSAFDQPDIMVYITITSTYKGNPYYYVTVNVTKGDSVRDTEEETYQNEMIIRITPFTCSGKYVISVIVEDKVNNCVVIKDFSYTYIDRLQTFLYIALVILALAFVLVVVLGIRKKRIMDIIGIAENERIETLTKEKKLREKGN